MDFLRIFSSGSFYRNYTDYYRIDKQSDVISILPQAICHRNVILYEPEFERVV